MRYVEIYVEPGRPQMTIGHMRIAFWKTKSTNTHSELYSEVSSVKNTTIHVWLNDGVY